MSPTAEHETPDGRRAPHADHGLLARLGSAQAALGAFVAVEGIAFVVFLRAGRYAWFSQDEWDFLADRSASSTRDLFRPKNEHWTTLPVLMFRLLWWVVGLRSYVPYLVPLILLHLLIAALLRVVMRRAGVNAWVATAAATVFVLFGSGWFNLEYAFQVTFLGSLAFGLVHLLLADHEGGVDRRDFFGLLAGLAGLMCSGVALTMVAIVGVAVLVRRGWRTALLHTAPLGVIYGIWLLAIGHEGSNRLASITDALRFIRREIPATFGAIGQLPGVGVALALMLIVGAVLAWLPLRGSTLRTRIAAPGALLVGALVFDVLNGLSRGEFAAITPPGAASRYRYIVAALMLPAIAIAADAIIRRWRVLAPVAVSLLLIGIPGNVRTLFDRAPDMRIEKGLILTSARLPISHSLPRRVQPDAFTAPWVTVGWLLDGIASGRVPDAGPMTRSYIASRTLDLALQPTNRAQPTRCVELVRPVVRVIGVGRVLADPLGSVSVTNLPPGAPPSAVRGMRQGSVVAVVGPLRLRFAPTGAGRAILCG